MVEIQIASKRSIKGYIKSSRNCIPCRVTDGLLIRGNNSFVIFDFGIINEDGCKLVLNFRCFSGNGFVNIKVDNYNKRYYISNNMRVEIPYVKDLRITRDSECIGDLSLTYIGVIKNKEIDIKSLEEGQTFFDQNSSDINFINSTFSEKENPLIEAQKKAINNVINKPSIERVPLNNIRDRARHLNKKLFTNLKDDSLNLNDIKCHSHNISNIKDGEKYKLLLFFGRPFWALKDYNAFFSMMDVYDIIVLNSIEFTSKYIENINLDTLIEKSFYILCDDNSYNKILNKNIDLSKILNIKAMSYKDCIDKVLLAAVDVKEIEIKKFLNEENNKVIMNKEENKILIKKEQEDKISGDLKFKIVVPAYNSQKWIRKTLNSIVCQNYTNYDVCIVDDKSTEKNQVNIIKEYCEKYNSDKNTWKYILNNKRKGALFNIVNAIRNSDCNDEDVIITLDGDDWLYDENVLNKVAKAYEGDILLTYGQYMSYPSNTVGHCKPYDKKVIQARSFRRDEWRMSHLRTFKYKLFSNIKEKDFIDSRKKRYFEMAWDLALMFPMAEMAGDRIKFISDILYTYNRENPINDDKVNLGLQASTNGLIRKMQKYDYLNFKKKEDNVGIVDNKKLHKQEIKKEPEKIRFERTSISDNINYPQFCKLAANDDSIFDNFRKAPIYIETLEHVNYKFAKQYVKKVIQSENSNIIEKIDLFKTNDNYGNPEIKSFGNVFKEISPTTTRYISVLNDMFNIFGSLTNYKIIEVGAGYGGQCKIIHNAFNIQEYVIVDLDEAMMLIKKYLSKFNISPKFQSFSNLNYEESDLFISNYAFSECEKELQSMYLNKLAKGAKNGFMLCNFVSNRFKLQSYSLKELIETLRNFGKNVNVEDENPLTFKGNKLIYWKN